MEARTLNSAGHSYPTMDAAYYAGHVKTQLGADGTLPYHLTPEGEKALSAHNASQGATSQDAGDGGKAAVAKAGYQTMSEGTPGEYFAKPDGSTLTQIIPGPNGYTVKSKNFLGDNHSVDSNHATLPEALTAAERYHSGNLAGTQPKPMDSPVAGGGDKEPTLPDGWAKANHSAYDQFYAHGNHGIGQHDAWAAHGDNGYSSNSKKANGQWNSPDVHGSMEEALAAAHGGLQAAGLTPADGDKEPTLPDGWVKDDSTIKPSKDSPHMAFPSQAMPGQFISSYAGKAAGTGEDDDTYHPTMDAAIQHLKGKLDAEQAVGGASGPGQGPTLPDGWSKQRNYDDKPVYAHGDFGSGKHAAWVSQVGPNSFVSNAKTSLGSWQGQSTHASLEDALAHAHSALQKEGLVKPQGATSPTLPDGWKPISAKSDKGYKFLQDGKTANVKPDPSGSGWQTLLHDERGEISQGPSFATKEEAMAHASGMAGKPAPAVTPAAPTPASGNATAPATGKAPDPADDVSSMDSHWVQNPFDDDSYVKHSPFDTDDHGEVSKLPNGKWSAVPWGSAGGKVSTPAKTFGTAKEAVAHIDAHSAALSGQAAPAAPPSQPAAAQFQSKGFVTLGGVKHPLTDEPATAKGVDSILGTSIYDSGNDHTTAAAVGNLKEHVLNGKIKTKGELLQAIAGGKAIGLADGNTNGKAYGSDIDQAVETHGNDLAKMIASDSDVLKHLEPHDLGGMAAGAQAAPSGGTSVPPAHLNVLKHVAANPGDNGTTYGWLANHGIPYSDSQDAIDAGHIELNKDVTGWELTPEGQKVLAAHSPGAAPAPPPSPGSMAAPPTHDQANIAMEGHSFHPDAKKAIHAAVDAGVPKQQIWNAISAAVATKKANGTTKVLPSHVKTALANLPAAGATGGTQAAAQPATGAGAKPEPDYVTINGQKQVLSNNKATVALTKSMPPGWNFDAIDTVKNHIQNGTIKTQGDFHKVLAMAQAHADANPSGSGGPVTKAHALYASLDHDALDGWKLSNPNAAAQLGPHSVTGNIAGKAKMPASTPTSPAQAPAAAPPAPVPPEHKAMADSTPTTASWPPAGTPPSGAGEPPFVTVAGKQTTLDPNEPPNTADALAGGKYSSKAKDALTQAVADGKVKNGADMAQALAVAHAANKGSQYQNVTGYSMQKGLDALEGGGIAALKTKAESGDAEAKALVANLDPHNVLSPKEEEAAKLAAMTGDDVMHKKVGGQGGGNPGGAYEDVNGQKWYAKSNAGGADQNHTEALANAVYNSLGLAAPQSKVFDKDGKSYHATPWLDSKGELGQHGVTPDLAREALKGFAADVLLRNHDVIGSGKNNLLVGADGKTLTRVDNGGAGLFRALGEKKDPVGADKLREWDSYADPKVNSEYADVFKKAGIKSADGIPGIEKQLQAVADLGQKTNNFADLVDQFGSGMSAATKKATLDMIQKRAALLEQKRQEIQASKAQILPRDYKVQDYQTAFAKGKAGHAKNVPAEEKSAISYFKGSGYVPMNSAVRTPGALATASPDVQAHVKHLDSLMGRPESVVGSDIVLSRKISAHAHSPETSHYLNVQPGEVVTDTGYGSTSTSPHTWSGNYHLQLHAPKETKGVWAQAYTSSNSSEHEFTLPRNHQYRIIAVHPPGNDKLDGDPDGWSWNSGSHRVRAEMIVPGINDDATLAAKKPAKAKKP